MPKWLPIDESYGGFHLDRHSNSTCRCTYSEYSRGRENSGYADFHSFRYGGCRKKIYAMGCKAIVVKGGHHIGNAVDVLFDGENFYHFETSRIDTKILMGQAVPFLLQSLPSLQREKVFRLQSNLQRHMSQWQSNTLLRLGKAVARRTISTNCISMVYLKNRQVQNEL